MPLSLKISRNYYPANVLKLGRYRLEGGISAAVWRYQPDIGSICLMHKCIVSSIFCEIYVQYSSVCRYSLYNYNITTLTCVWAYRPDVIKTVVKLGNRTDVAPISVLPGFKFCRYRLMCLVFIYKSLEKTIKFVLTLRWK